MNSATYSPALVRVTSETMLGSRETAAGISNTGTLNEQLMVGSDFYGEELEFKIQRLTSLFEPAVILFMGCAVGFVAIAMISAMYGIYRQVQF